MELPPAHQHPGIRPRPTLGRRLDATARQCFPATVTALALLVLAGPLGLPGEAELLPAVALACVWFWSLFRPGSMSPPVVFLLGLLCDLLGLAPLGSSVLILLAVHGLAFRWRHTLTRLGFAQVWLAFVAVGTGTAAMGWALTSALSFRLMPVAPAMFQAGLTAALYPALAALFTRAHRGLADPEQA